MIYKNFGKVLFILLKGMKFEEHLLDFYYIIVNINCADLVDALDHWFGLHQSSYEGLQGSKFRRSRFRRSEFRGIHGQRN